MTDSLEWTKPAGALVTVNVSWGPFRITEALEYALGRLCPLMSA